MFRGIFMKGVLAIFRIPFYLFRKKIKLPELAGKRTFLRRTKATAPPDASDPDVPTTASSIDTDKFPKRGVSRFKPKESARNETSAGVTRRPSLGAGARRSERPATRNFVRRRLGGANVTTTTTAAPSLSSTAAAVTRRPFRIASRRRPGSPIITTTTTTTTTTPVPTTAALTTQEAVQVTTPSSTFAQESEESLQDIGDTDAIEDPSLEPKVPKKTTKVPRRPLVNLKDDIKDQNPSATTDDERKRQSKKYSSSFKQNQLDDLLKVKDEETTTAKGTTVEEYNAETVLAIATHQLITAPLPSITEYDEGTKPTRPKTTQIYTQTSPEYTITPTYEEYNTATHKITPTNQDFVQTTLTDAYSIYDTPRITTYEDAKTTAEFTANSGRTAYTYEPRTNYDVPKTTEDITTPDSRQTFTANSRGTAAYTATYEPRTNYDAPKTTEDNTTPDSRQTFTAKSRGTAAYTATYEPRTNYDAPKTTEDITTTDSRQLFTPKSRGTAYTATYEPRTNYDVPKTTEDITTTDSRQPSTQDIEAGKLTTYISTDTFPTTGARQTGYTNIPTNYEPLISTTFEVPKQRATLSRYPTTQVYQPITNQYASTTRDYSETPERPTYSTPDPKSPRGFSSPNIITPGYSGVQRGGAKYQSASEKYVTPAANDVGYSTSGYKSSSQDPAYFTREYLLESPVTKTYDEEYQYLSPTTPQTTTRKTFRKKIQRRISTTLRPTTPTYVPEITTTPRPSRVPSKRPFEKIAKVEPNRTYRPVVNYDYYDDSAERVALKYAEGTKVILHGKGSIECLDVGNFPHPSSCRKFISCARMEFGSLLGWEYICPKGLSFDPVGGICNWSAGLGCDEKDT